MTTPKVRRIKAWAGHDGEQFLIHSPEEIFPRLFKTRKEGRDYFGSAVVQIEIHILPTKKRKVR